VQGALHTALKNNVGCKMMKRGLLFFIVAVWGLSVWGGLADDGFLTAGEYAGTVIWRSYDPPLIVDGMTISVRDNGLLIVQSTSTPLGVDVGGVYDILLGNNSQLVYLDGVTELIAMNANATANLKAGSINYIKSMQYTETTGTDPHVDLYCLPGWSWISDNPLLGIEGQWWNGSPFSIKFINHAEFDTAWTNINIITPEPATLILHGLGGLMLRRKR